MLTTISIGKAIEFRVVSELLLRGHEVYLATADSGVDLILGNGKKLQVKGSNKGAKGHSHYERYTFSFKTWHKRGKKYTTHELEGVDFVICWAIQDNLFYIIPAELIRGKYSVRVKPSSQSQSLLTPYQDKWELLS